MKFIIKYKRTVALTLMTIFGSELLLPTTVLALTSGPSQPEVQGFTPIGANDMVDLFSGDFNYNIPLMDIGGYPINLAYSGGASMDQEASWVGLGWTLNPGVINRNVRALPDDFKGDLINKENNIKGNETYGISTSYTAELFGVETNKSGSTGPPDNDDFRVTFGLGLSYNNYNGMGFEMSLEPSLTAAEKGKNQLDVGLGLSASSTSGASVKPSVSFSRVMQDNATSENKLTNRIGSSFNTRGGVQQLTFSTSMTRKGPKTQTTNKKGKTKTVQKSRSSNGGTGISLADPTYTPQIGLSMMNVSASLAMTVGVAVFGAHPKLNMSGYYSGQFLLDKEKSLPAYGYQYLDEGQVLDKVMLDFNREKDGGFSESTPNLPITNLTYDIYSVSGQGVSGTYRPHRGDVGIVFDSKTSNGTAGMDLGGLEIGTANTFHTGLNITVNTVIGQSGKWTKNNDMASLLEFSGPKTADPFYEPVYFKQAGEKALSTNPDYIASIGQELPMSVSVNSDLRSVPAVTSFEKFSSVTAKTQQPVASPIETDTREPRNQVFTYLTADQAADLALEPNIEVFATANTFTMQSSGEYANSSTINRTDYPDHHFSEIKITRDDGARYVYGIPVYNNTKAEVTFAVDPTSSNVHCDRGIIDYNPATDATQDNTSGIDNYFSKTETPGYAYAYLLTAILSHDYVDLTGDGPTDDDLGTYTKFNYRKAVSDFGWRVPFNANEATHSEGLRSNPAGGAGQKGDDKGSYSYGTKDIWFIHSIETKTHVAEFHISSRSDAYGVVGEHGGINTGKDQKKLDQIKLYTKRDRVESGSAAIPLKVVHFEYDYTLCSDIENNTTAGDGKLTLKKVYFTYGNSYRARLNTYAFDYGVIKESSGTVMNPDYNLKGYDRWGSYKENQLASTSTCNYVSDPMSNADFPYTDQRALPTTHAAALDANADFVDDLGRSLADINAYAWNLTTISLPSGGKIDVHYESDDYAYVQDRKAMQMFTVKGCTDIPLTNAPNDFLYGSSGELKEYIAIELDQPIETAAGATDAANTFIRDYLKDHEGKVMDYLYFKFFLDIGTANLYEFVPGYAEFAMDGAVPDIEAESSLSNNKYDIIYIKLKAVSLRDREAPASHATVNPIALAGWNFTKLYRQQVAYDLPDPARGNAVGILTAMGASLKSIRNIFTGFNAQMRMDDKSRKFKHEKSFIRLYNPDGFKEGGGHRVKRVELSDEWGNMASGNASSVAYGQEYDYTIEENGRQISSGVAAYEPLIGNDENPFRQPVFVTEKQLLIPDAVSYLEEPFGESFFPGASVGYRQVSVRNLADEDITRHATGKVVHEFYTAKDYPTITRQSMINPVRKKPNPLLKILQIRSIDYMTATQGYVIELNDMHGKPKAEWVYQENGLTPLSGSSYQYVEDASGRITNTVDVMDRNGVISSQEIGVDYDFVVDMRENKTESYSSGTGGNLETFIASLLPIAVPAMLPKFSQEVTRFRSAVTTKVINRYALTKSVTNYSRGSNVTTENLLYDASTGEVLLTQTENQFEDPVYSFQYPAHLVYDQMGMAYRNVGITVSAAAATSSPSTYFAPGDVVTTNGALAWVMESSAGGLQFVDASGTPVTPSNDVTVIRSGRRNRQNLPIGSITCMSNPIQGSGLFFSSVLSASAMEFRDDWKILCQCGPAPGATVNPYTLGLKGNWNAWRTWYPITNREQTITPDNRNTNIRTDGRLAEFSPFWEPAGPPWSNSQTNWTFVDEATYFTEHSSEVERKDAIGNYSAAVYGYNQQLPLLTARNSQYREVAFDGFEDYSGSDCLDMHFSYKEQVGLSSSAEITSEQSHTGKRSIKIDPNSSITLTKTIDECN